MSKLSAGELDRRVQFQLGAPSTDAAGDEVLVWADIEGGKRWAKIRDRQPTENPATGTAQQVLRQVDSTITVRFDSFTRYVGPETHRITYRDRVYEIVGLGEGDREDAIIFLCCSRPDQRGARGVEPVSGQP